MNHFQHREIENLLEKTIESAMKDGAAKTTTKVQAYGDNKVI